MAAWQHMNKVMGDDGGKVVDVGSLSLPATWKICDGWLETPWSRQRGLNRSWRAIPIQPLLRIPKPDLIYIGRLRSATSCKPPTTLLVHECDEVY